MDPETMAWDKLEEKVLVENIDTRTQHILIIFLSQLFIVQNNTNLVQQFAIWLGGVPLILDIFSCNITCSFPEMALKIRGQFNRSVFSSEQ